MNKQISQITLKANPKVLKNLMQKLVDKIINCSDYQSFDLKVRADKKETKIFLKEKEGTKLTKENWKKIIDFIDEETPELSFIICIKYY